MRPFHPQFILEALPQLILYLPVTAAVVAGTVFFGSLLGILLAAGKIRRGRAGRILANLYIYVIRCVPSIVLLFLVYYGLPELLNAFGININDAGKGFFVITTFSLLFAAAMAEVFRSAYEAVDGGQMEAALSIGMSAPQAYVRIILPQALVAALPNICNATVNLLKSTSLAFMMTVKDVTAIAKIDASFGYNFLEAYLIIFVVYIFLCSAVQGVFHLTERGVSAYRKPAVS